MSKRQSKAGRGKAWQFAIVPNLDCQPIGLMQELAQRYQPAVLYLYSGYTKK